MVFMKIKTKNSVPKTDKIFNQICEKYFLGDKTYMAKKLGMSLQTISQYFSGKRKPGFEVLSRLYNQGIDICVFFGKSADDLQIAELKSLQASLSSIQRKLECRV